LYIRTPCLQAWEFQRNKINKALETKSPLIIKNTDVFIEECWDKVKEEYGYVIVEPLERIYKIFRRKNEKL